MTEAVQNQNQIQETEPQENPISARIRNGIQRFVEKHTPEAHTQQMMRQYETILSKIPEGTLHTYAESLRPFMNRWTKATGYVQTVSEMVLPALVFGGAAYAVSRFRKKGMEKNIISQAGIIATGAIAAKGKPGKLSADILPDESRTKAEAGVAGEQELTNTGGATDQKEREALRKQPEDELARLQTAPDYSNKYPPTPVNADRDTLRSEIPEFKPIPPSLDRTTLLAKHLNSISQIFPHQLAEYSRATTRTLSLDLKEGYAPSSEFQPNRLPQTLFNFLGQLMFLLPDDETRRYALDNLISQGGDIWDTYRQAVPESEERYTINDPWYSSRTTTSFSEWLTRTYQVVFDDDWFDNFLKQRFDYADWIIDKFSNETGFSFRNWMKFMKEIIHDDYTVADMRDWLRRLT